MRLPRRLAACLAGSGRAVRSARAFGDAPRRFVASPSAQQLTAEVSEWTETVQETVLTPLNGRLLGPLERRAFNESVPLPYVLLLGNHSSGKSSFINFLMGRDVQATGVAPTDDGFTVIAPGEADTDRDGASFVGDPSMGFSPLRSFGPGFMSHFKLKVRSKLSIEGLMLIDSPGMIDSPSQPSEEGSYERGYDFLGVTRWLAQHADVILLFFDPDKPGTTGETLACLTKSLAGMEHKLSIVMNKVDSFEHVHDFARAYGSLCWNLAKVIPRKDLPRIYTMFLPPEAIYRKAAQRSQPAAGLTAALAELDSIRDEVIHEVHSAPMRRVDNLITRTHDSAALLRMHALVVEEARSEYSAVRMRRFAAIGTLCAAGPSLAAAALMTDVITALPAAGLAAGFALAGAAAAIETRLTLATTQRELLSDAGLDRCFERSHVVAVTDGDEFALALWRRARPQVRSSLATLGLGAIAKVSADDISGLDRVIDGEVPALRRRAGSGGPGDKPGRALKRGLEGEMKASQAEK